MNECVQKESTRRTVEALSSSPPPSNHAASTPHCYHPPFPPLRSLHHLIEHIEHDGEGDGEGEGGFVKHQQSSFISRRRVVHCRVVRRHPVVVVIACVVVVVVVVVQPAHPVAVGILGVPDQTASQIGR